MARKTSSTAVPQPAVFIPTERGHEIQAPITERVFGIVNENNQLEIKRGNEVVTIQLPRDWTPPAK